MATVRVEPKLHAKLRSLSDSERRSISQVIEEAIDDYEKAKFWRAMHEGYARLRADPAAWSEYEQEVALWDTVSGDGLEDEEPYYAEEEARDEIAATTTPR
ncbi:MAG: ribbon-helix-helix protein, CopG family [Chloroflexia bacterium]|nr:ribbon-helix-helix protein, CopG family [Chloroflexia bacterium]